MYSKPLGESMNYGQSFVPGRLGRNSRPPGSPQPVAAPKPMGGTDRNTSSIGQTVTDAGPVLKQRYGRAPKNRKQPNPLMSAIMGRPQA
jgi:hypothetical protein